jgi:hypothetical protein
VRRLTGGLLVTLVVLASAGAGVGAWWLARDPGPSLPQISAYSRGQTVAVGPYFYCSVTDLEDCRPAGEQGVLRVGERDPVQLSVPKAIARAPWRLLRIYADERDATTTLFRPDTTLAVTVPTVDAQRGRLAGLVVQLMTLVQDQDGAVFDLPHAEWSVGVVWDEPAGR